jgi:hypothetical protein
VSLEAFRSRVLENGIYPQLVKAVWLLPTLCIVISRAFGPEQLGRTDKSIMIEIDNDLNSGSGSGFFIYWMGCVDIDSTLISGTVESTPIQQLGK